MSRSSAPTASPRRPSAGAIRTTRPRRRDPGARLLELRPDQLAGGQRPPVTTPAPGETVVKLEAQNIAFHQTSLTGPANTAFDLAFDNEDASVPHNVVIVDRPGTAVFTGDIFNGAATEDYSVPALAAGRLHLPLRGPPEHDGHAHDQVGGAPPTPARRQGWRTMAGQTLSTGSPGRGRVLFGLLDGDGWTWASLKAAFWFVAIIMLLGYIPDRAYYFIVFPTIDIGVNVISPINFCPPSNLTLPCPAPAGAPLPWSGSPTELALPAPRTDGDGRPGRHEPVSTSAARDGKTASDQTYQAPLFSGTFGPWKSSLEPARAANRSRHDLPEQLDLRDRRAWQPTASRPRRSTSRPRTPRRGAFGAVSPRTPPWPCLRRAPSATVVAASDGLIVLGRTDGNGPTTTVWKATADSTGQAGRVGRPVRHAPAAQRGARVGDRQRALRLQRAETRRARRATSCGRTLGTAAVAASPAPSDAGADAVLVQRGRPGLGCDEPAGRPDQGGRLHLERGDLPGRRQRRHVAPDRDLLDHARRERQHQRLAAPQPDRPAGEHPAGWPDRPGWPAARTPSSSAGPPPPA